MKRANPTDSKTDSSKTADGRSPVGDHRPNWKFSRQHNPQAKIGDTTRIIVRVLYWLCVAAALWFAYLNIAPYAAAVKFAMSNTMGNATTQAWLEVLAIGNLISFVSLVIPWIVGVILWAAIQTIEVFPIVLKHDRSFMRTVISDQEASQKFALSEDDDPAVTLLKQWYNRFPMLTVTKARNFSLFVYAIDFCICLLVYPPADGGFSNFFFLLMTGQFMALDWVNIALLIATLYAIEAIVHLLFFLGQITWYYRASRA